MFYYIASRILALTVAVIFLLINRGELSKFVEVAVNPEETGQFTSGFELMLSLLVLPAEKGGFLVLFWGE